MPASTGVPSTMRSQPSRRRSALVVLVLAALVAAPARGQHVTTPKEFFGHTIGEDYWLPNYTQFMGYWQKPAGEPPRALLDTTGLPAGGPPQLSMMVASRENT